MAIGRVLPRFCRHRPLLRFAGGGGGADQVFGSFPKQVLAGKASHRFLADFEKDRHGQW
jgi:hypothetical protein